MTKILPTHECNSITFPENQIPTFKGDLGLGLFTSNLRTRSAQMLSTGIWTHDPSDDEKVKISLRLAENITVLSSATKLADLFVLSVIHRLLSLFISSVKLSIDNSHMKTAYKYASSLAVSLVPALFSVYALGYPVNDLIMFSVINQVMGTASSYISVRISNFLRKLELISDNKEFSKTKYMTKLLVSTALDLALTFVLYGKELFLNPFQETIQGVSHVVTYCVTRTKSNDLGKVVALLHYTPPLISLSEKSIRLVARVATDTAIIAANKFGFGFARDLRSPFISNNFDKDSRVSYKEDSRTSQQDKKRKRKGNHSDEERGKKDGIPEVADNTQSSFSNTTGLDLHFTKTETKRRTGDKVKTRAQTATLQAHEEKAIDDGQDVCKYGVVIINGANFYYISGTKLPDNTWAILTTHDTEDGAFTRSLTSSGHVGNQKSAIKPLLGNTFEIRPKNTGKRALGELNKDGRGVLESILPLGEAIRAYESLKTLGEGVDPSFIVFNRTSKHENIAKNIISR